MDTKHLTLNGSMEFITFLYLYIGKNELINRKKYIKEHISKAKKDNKYKK